LLGPGLRGRRRESDLGEESFGDAVQQFALVLKCQYNAIAVTS